MCQHRVSPPKSHKVRTRWPSYRTSQPGMSSALSEVCRAIDMCTRRTQGRRAQDRASALGGNWKHDMPPTQQHLGPSRKRIHAWKSGYALIARPPINMATTRRRHQRRLPTNSIETRSNNCLPIATRQSSCAADGWRRGHCFDNQGQTWFC